MNGTSWIRLTSIDNIPPREGRSIVVGSQELAVFNLGDRFLAVDGRCPHRGGPLADGIVAGDTVVCPLHAWKVSLRSGGVERPSGILACVRTYETRVEGGIVNVRLDEEPGAPTVPSTRGGDAQWKHERARPTLGHCLSDQTG